MTSTCRICGAELSSSASHRDAVTNRICGLCLKKGAQALLDAIDAPVLLMEGNPRQVVKGNGRALQLFAKESAQVEGHRGGEVFDCIHSFTEAGCGKDANCDNCVIKGAIVNTFDSGMSHRGVGAVLTVKKGTVTEQRSLEVSTEKIGDLAFVRIDRYDLEA